VHTCIFAPNDPKRERESQESETPFERKRKARKGRDDEVITRGKIGCVKKQGHIGRGNQRGAD